MSANGKKVANFWQIPASEGDAQGSQRAVSGNSRNLAVPPRSNRLPEPRDERSYKQACTSFSGAAMEPGNGIPVFFFGEISDRLEVTASVYF